MMWNYRVINFENAFYIGEVYYNDKGIPTGFTDAVVCAVFDEEASKENFEEELKRFNEAAEKQIIIFKKENGIHYWKEEGDKDFKTMEKIDNESEELPKKTQ